MSIAFYTGVSGMMAFSENLNVVSHNIANVNTHGYKKQRASFEDLLYTRMNIHRNYAARNDGEAEQAAAELSTDKVGHGVRIGSVDVMYGQSGMQTTDYPLDFAINGEGFFAVQTNTGIEYTRSGAFTLSMTGARSAALITADGAQVLDSRQQPIKITFDEKGNPLLDDLSTKLGVYQFNNPYGLSPTSGSRFLQTQISGEATAARGATTDRAYQLVQGALEYSSVDLGEEMVKVIESQRAFQMNSRVVQTADQLDDIINNLR